MNSRFSADPQRNEWYCQQQGVRRRPTYENAHSHEGESAFCGTQASFSPWRADDPYRVGYLRKDVDRVCRASREARPCRTIAPMPPRADVARTTEDAAP